MAEPVAPTMEGSGARNRLTAQKFGEVAERLKAHDSKSCEGLYPSEGSNPSLSAKQKKVPAWGLFCLLGMGGFDEKPSGSTERP